MVGSRMMRSPLAIALGMTESTWVLEWGTVRHPYLFRLISPEGSAWEATGQTIAEGVKALRAQMEPLGYRFCCNGARANAHPGHMSVQMGEGDVVHLLKLGKRPKRGPRVALLDYAPRRKVTTLSVQNRFFSEWFESLR